MDQLSAHLDRGWELLNDGHFTAALEAAGQALALDEELAEALYLRGCAFLARQQPDDAREALEAALALDDSLIEAHVALADATVAAGHSPEEALGHLDEAAEIAIDAQDRRVVATRRSELLLGLGRKDAAKAAAQSALEAPTPETDDERAALLRLCAELELGEHGTELAKTLATSDGSGSLDTLLALALWHDRTGQVAQASTLYAQAYERYRGGLPKDNARLDPSWVEQALQLLSPDALQLLNEVPVFLLDVPSLEVVLTGLDPRMPVWIEALDTRERGSAANGPQIKHVVVYAANLVVHDDASATMAEGISAALEMEFASWRETQPER